MLADNKLINIKSYHIIDIENLNKNDIDNICNHKYIIDNILSLFPGYINVIKNIMLKIDKLSDDEFMFACSFFYMTSQYEIDDPRMCINLWKEISYPIKEYEREIILNINEFIYWMTYPFDDKNIFLFKLIFIYHLIVSSRLVDITGYGLSCPVDVKEDSIFISLVENTIIDFIYLTYNDIRYVEYAFMWPYGCESIQHVKDIIKKIDISCVEIKYRKKLKKINLKYKVENINTESESNVRDIEVVLSEIDTKDVVFDDYIDSEYIKPIFKNVNLRPKQQDFRNNVLKKYGTQCSVCGISINELIEAAHIIPKKENGIDSPENGLPLCALHHKAYDSDFFCIEPNSLKIISNPNGPTLKELLITKQDITDLKSFPSKEILIWRWNQWIGSIKQS